MPLPPARVAEGDVGVEGEDGALDLEEILGRESQRGGGAGGSGRRRRAQDSGRVFDRVSRFVGLFSLSSILCPSILHMYQMSHISHKM